MRTAKVLERISYSCLKVDISWIFIRFYWADNPAFNINKLNDKEILYK